MCLGSSLLIFEGNTSKVSSSESSRQKLVVFWGKIIYYFSLLRGYRKVSHSCIQVLKIRHFFYVWHVNCSGDFNAQLLPAGC